MRFGLNPGMYMRTWRFMQNAGRRNMFTQGGHDGGIAGKWENKLKSTVTFKCNNGRLDGTYTSAVGDADDAYILSGRYIQEPNTGVVLLGWVVAWKNKKCGDSHSTTSWSGIYYPEEKVIRTQWLMTDYNEDQDPPQGYWETTTINHDEFEKIE